MHTLFISYKNHVFSTQPGKRDRDNYRQLTMMFLKSKAFSDPWQRSKQLSSNEEASRGLLSNHDILILFAPSSGFRSSLTLLVLGGSRMIIRTGNNFFQEFKNIHFIQKNSAKTRSLKANLGHDR